MLDSKYQDSYRKKIPDHVISNGIWEARELEHRQNGDRVYTMVCVNSHHPDLKQGTEVKMHEATLVELCHRVKIVHLPKYKSLIKK